MTHIAARRATRAWILLVLLTVLNMVAGQAGAGGLVGSGVVLVAAVAKGRWMLMDFLKLRHVPPGWRILLSSWLVLVAASAWIAAAIPRLRG
ncbi:cytochrome C oxidase subunit IV family protein [Microvirga sp. BT689]|uniref:cytochrome C oxidase subunit IV family protein n=1 Tax=Microvirga arvi TaxID=2778731 RepID=UPI00194EDBEF|nr:cytochrome C oxidase subunit IV family protein [Microvirga arvi]MBM6579840.1 cytochrome C oxidase subunit IV family protein [Microvirga arvi]